MIKNVKNYFISLQTKSQQLRWFFFFFNLSLLSSFSYPLYLFIYFSAKCQKLEEQARSNGKRDIWNHHTGPIFPNTALGLHEEWSKLQCRELVSSGTCCVFSLFSFIESLG
jgi:hypothetical protein